MVSSKDRDSVWISYLQCDEKSHCLNRVITSIHVVAHEEIVVIRQLTSDLEEFLQVIELTMDVSTNGDGSSYWLHVALVHKDLFCFVAQSLDAILRQRFALK